MPVKRGEKQLAENRKARHEYFIEDTYECGMALVGTEVKSIRLGKVNIKDSYVKIKNGEAFVVGMHISPYEKGNQHTAFIGNFNPVFLFDVFGMHCVRTKQSLRIQLRTFLII